MKDIRKQCHVDRVFKFDYSGKCIFKSIENLVNYTMPKNTSDLIRDVVFYNVDDGSAFITKLRTIRVLEDFCRCEKY